MVLNVHRNHGNRNVHGLLGTGRRGEGVMEVRGEGDYYTYRYTVTPRMLGQTDSLRTTTTTVEHY